MTTHDTGSAGPPEQPDPPEQAGPPQEAEQAELPTIRLDDFLKFCGLVGTGGQAKLLIQGGEVWVNGQVETRRRKQLVVGDVVELLGERFEVEASG